VSISTLNETLGFTSQIDPGPIISVLTFLSHMVAIKGGFNRVELALPEVLSPVSPNAFAVSLAIAVFALS
jgi:hypothetical protein